jgi:hypothetical protein
MENLITVLVKRLVDRGLEPGSVPAFVRNLSHVIVSNPHIGIAEVNRQLDALGWDDVELDHVTYQLGIAIFEPDPDAADLPEDIPSAFGPMTVAWAG